jgi:hypothetical protein
MLKQKKLLMPLMQLRVFLMKLLFQTLEAILLHEIE